MGVVFFLLSPVILTAFAAIIALIVSAVISFGVCLIVIGITGKLMNKLYSKHTGEEKSLSKRSYNTVAVITGTTIIIVTIGSVIYQIVSMIT